MSGHESTAERQYFQDKSKIELEALSASTPLLPTDKAEGKVSSDLEFQHCGKRADKESP